MSHLYKKMKIKVREANYRVTNHVIVIHEDLNMKSEGSVNYSELVSYVAVVAC